MNLNDHSATRVPHASGTGSSFFSSLGTTCSKPSSIRLQAAFVALVEIGLFVCILISFVWDDCWSSADRNDVHDASMSVYIVLDIWTIVAAVLLLLAVKRMLHVLMIPWLVLIPIKMISLLSGLVFAVMEALDGGKLDGLDDSDESDDVIEFLNFSVHVSGQPQGCSRNETIVDFGYFNSVAGVRGGAAATRVFFAIALFLVYVAAAMVVFRCYSLAKRGQSRPSDPPMYQPPINTLALNSYQSPAVPPRAPKLDPVPAGRNKIVLPPLNRRPAV